MSKIALQDERGFNQVFAPVGSTPLRMRRRNDWFIAQAGRVGATRILSNPLGYTASSENPDFVPDLVVDPEAKDYRPAY